MLTNTLNRRVSYAKRRRQSIHKGTLRVLWKRSSRHIA